MLQSAWAIRHWGGAFGRRAEHSRDRHGGGDEHGPRTRIDHAHERDLQQCHRDGKGEHGHLVGAAAINLCTEVGYKNA